MTTRENLRETLDAVGHAFDYPRPGRSELVRRSARRVRAVDGPEAMVSALDRLADFLDAEPLARAEELYTGLFDLSPVCTLNVGYHVFGEGYERGALLAGLAGEMRRVGIDTGEEIADFLPTLFRLLGRLEEAEDRIALLDTLLLPALGRMTATLEERREAWCDVLRALPALLELARRVETVGDKSTEQEALVHA